MICHNAYIIRNCWSMSRGGASPRCMAGHGQVISRISKGSQYIFIIAVLLLSIARRNRSQGSSQGGGISARAFALARPGEAPPLYISNFYLRNNSFHRSNLFRLLFQSRWFTLLYATKLTTAILLLFVFQRFVFHLCCRC